jgi:hypothetical protein
VSTSASIIDIGGGASRLVDALLNARFAAVTVLDLSKKALATAKTRLGSLGEPAARPPDTVGYNAAFPIQSISMREVRRASLPTATGAPQEPVADAGDYGFGLGHKRSFCRHRGLTLRALCRNQSFFTFSHGLCDLARAIYEKLRHRRERAI